ncbi:hypothetical protein J6590_051996 [Homalodisca vitripennis]|nr:hypothetical protein J6590_051996 [Homalodisca vitripennis]
MPKKVDFLLDCKKGREEPQGESREILESYISHIGLTREENPDLLEILPAYSRLQPTLSTLCGGAICGPLGSLTYQLLFPLFYKDIRKQTIMRRSDKTTYLVQMRRSDKTTYLVQMRRSDKNNKIKSYFSRNYKLYDFNTFTGRQAEGGGSDRRDMSQPAFARPPK